MGKREPERLTMEGGARKKNGEFPSDAGVIPRAVRQIFDILEAQSAEYSMKFTDDKSKKPIALMEDGKGGVLVRGLEEEIVTTANEIYKILEKGSAKRRTAETLLNKQSSRSHSIFSITIHIKECTPEGEEMIKCGKLNLVDLAGSENIHALVPERAREAGEINKSLLTLGRVINALVEHSGHVPYRDSKLTRLLRDSLGGKTKTCIIATISPSIHCLEETLSTLDYAHRAKNIKNKPEINQKMMKSALIKDLYFEIDRLKQEVYAAREKNGIYIPRDRYLQDEAEKKAMSEKIERMELDLDSRDKRLVEVQELYNSQQQLTVELSDKLEKTEKKLQETEHALLDLEERHRQANANIKEKEYLISNLLKSEKALIRRLSYEKNWRMLHQMSLICSPRLVCPYSENSLATEELRGHLEKLKTMYGSGINVLDDLAGELDSNSHSTFGRLNCEVSKHSSALEEVCYHCCLEELLLRLILYFMIFKRVCIARRKLSAYAQQQREAHSRAVESTRSISQITVNFFKTLDGHASKLGEIVEEAQAINDQKLSELEKKFEECAANEEKQLLAKVAELLAGSNARKKKETVKCAIDGLRESAATRTDKLQQEIYSCSGNGKSDMEDILSKCLEQAKLGAQQWKNAQASLLHLEKSNVASVDEIVRGGMNTIEVLRERFSSAVSSALEDADTGSRNLLTSIDRSLQLDHEACSNLDSMIVPCCGDLRELNSGHHHKIVEITENAGKCLQEEYMVDEPSCSTPRRRPINPPSIASIEELKTPSFEELLKSFWDARSSKQANGDVKHILEAVVSLRDSRLPLTAIN
ncbi:UNVERIFIED_CONTAM: Kinesin-like protein KIN-5D [Sesamum angustifolium]|uniref:Kinesin-like protein n=1 Tax=Sesamum angustifolium TaxID=2727405 RepID=A0AAW2QQ81_9LAMI